MQEISHPEHSAPATSCPVLSSTEFQEKLLILVNFKTIQDFPQWYWVVPSRPKFFLNFPEQQDQT